MNMPSNWGRDRGFSLIELMISITLGLIVIFGVGQIFVATRTSYSSQQGLSGMQQNSRVGIKLMADAVRNAGDMGFSNLSGLMGSSSGVSNTVATLTPATAKNVYQLTDFTAAGPQISQLLRVDSGLTIYEYNGTGPDDAFDLPDPLAPGTSGDWTPALPSPISGRALRFSDVIVTRYMDPKTFIAKADGNLQSSGGLSSGDGYCTPGAGVQYGSLDINSSDLLAQIDTLPKHMYAIADMRNVNFFQAVNIGPPGGALSLRSNVPGAFPGNVAGECGSLSTTTSDGGRIGRVHIDIYFVGMNPDTREPGLWRAEFTGDGADGFTLEELVEGVENMQVTAGLTMMPANPRRNGVSTAATDRIVTGAELNDPASLGLPETAAQVSRRIMSVRISTLMRSEANAAGQTNNLEYEVGRSEVDPVDDRRLRQVYESNVGIRNRQRMATGLANYY